MGPKTHIGSDVLFHDAFLTSQLDHMATRQVAGVLWGGRSQGADDPTGANTWLRGAQSS
eukprot:CAMPEP_0174696824 /NCGR_PEP_ID=MMETSP1094-20130205/2878_1 /TAXON_ID=156173 /ORGANISM="Chrysochromulina brevifilum, Strain UTEX LB 985" /LENGTH=58 /DNA_ID=CAMNT_0015893689 /DNA_START=13 /DNA_END=189 /DNA_ORIENTATION=-